MKKIIIGLLMAIIGFAYCKDVTEVQSIDGGQRNQITPGGGGGASFDSSLNYSLTGSNTFTGPVLMSSNLTVMTMIGINTNVNASTWNADDYVLQVRPNPNSGFTSARIGINGTSGSGYSIDDGNLHLEIGSTASNFRILTQGSGLGSLLFSMGGSQIMSLNSTTVTLGASSSSALTINAATAAIPNGLNIGSGQLNIPASGAITNGSSFVSINTVTASNIVAQTTDGTSYFNTGTNQTMRIIVNNATGTLKTEAFMTVATNSLTSSSPAANTIYTNNNSRLNVSVNCAFAANSSVMLWTVTGAQTNIYDRKFFASAATNMVSGWIQPNSLYMVSNFTGTVTPIAGEWNETRF